MEAKNLFVEIGVSGFELLVDIATDMVDKLGLRERLTAFSLTSTLCHYLLIYLIYGAVGLVVR